MTNRTYVWSIHDGEERQQYPFLSLADKRELAAVVMDNAKNVSIP